ncbi:MAG: cytochrome c3 family protein [Verrucomicrobia bacterium]|nr:cytochrome c3 family protein [Verrucomicrobiota bacterium]
MKNDRVTVARIRRLALIVLALAPSLAWGAGFPISECLDCHEDATLSKTVDGARISLAIEAARFRGSVHGSLLCTDCHTGIEDPIHDDLPPAQCASCHEKAAAEYASSIHGLSQAIGESAAATCADCHGTHYVPPARHADSPVFKLNLPATCSRCHSNQRLTGDYQLRQPDAVAQYTDSIHGKALLKMGLIVAPSCNDCHGVHDIVRSVDRTSPIHHANIAKTCGTCHLGVEKTYLQSAHGKALVNGDPGAPTCTDCHTAHTIEKPRQNHFKAQSDQRCGTCHQDRLERYGDTYHGKAMALGRPNVAPDVAACYDCHGYHDILPGSNPESRLSTEHIVETCRQCHPGANQRFAQYIPHADPLDRENYPILHATFWAMTCLLLGVFGFFGVHTSLWFHRSLRTCMHDTKSFQAVRRAAEKDTEWFTRFRPFERFLHYMVATSFLLLVLTGMPLKFYDARWAGVIFQLIGGVDVARWLHHFGAIVTFLYFALHLSSLAIRFWSKRSGLRDPETGSWSWKQLIKVAFGPDSLVPSLQDWRDFVAHTKWFLGKGPRPQFDRWTYWEKFDYFAVFWGVAIIGLSGLILWFPEFFSLFLPGWIINIALIVHSDEALLAAGFIFTFHFFNTHFRPDRFPMDTVIFSGRISRTELLHERAKWHDRLKSSPPQTAANGSDLWNSWKPIARTFGFGFFGLGLILLALIVYAMVRHLF